MKSKVTRMNLLMVIDIVLIVISISLSYLLRFDFSVSSIPDFIAKDISNVILVAILVKIISFFVFKLYSSLWRYAGVYEMTLIFKAALIGNLITLSIVSISPLWMPRGVVVISFLLDMFLIGGIRFLYRSIRKFVSGNIGNLKVSNRVLIVGAGEAGALIVREIKNNTELKMLSVAIVDDDKAKMGRKIYGVPIVGQIRDLVTISEKYEIDEIIIAIPTASRELINLIYSQCKLTNCKIKIVPSLTQDVDENFSIRKVRDVNLDDLLGRAPIELDLREISIYLQNKIVMVTGGGGSIGSELCRQISKFNPAHLLILENYENNAYEINTELKKNYPYMKISVIIANIRDRGRMEQVFAKFRPQVVFHAAAHKHVPLMEDNPGEAILNNVFGTLNIVECSGNNNVERFVYISTDKAVNPTNIMGASKRLSEMVVQSYGVKSKTEFAVVRFGNVLGSNGSVVPLFKKQIELGGPVTVTHKDIERYFMTIPEAVQLVIQAGSMAKGGEIFILDMGAPVKILDLANNLIRLSGLEPDVDIKIEFIGLRPGEKMFEELFLDEEGIMKTKNNKIFVAKPVVKVYDEFKLELQRMFEFAENSEFDIKNYIIKLVPNYRVSESGS